MKHITYRYANKKDITPMATTLRRMVVDALFIAGIVMMAVVVSSSSSPPLQALAAMGGNNIFGIFRQRREWLRRLQRHREQVIHQRYGSIHPGGGAGAGAGVGSVGSVGIDSNDDSVGSKTRTPSRPRDVTTSYPSTTSTRTKLLLHNNNNSNDDDGQLLLPQSNRRPK
jgi:hypothetical protein